MLLTTFDNKLTYLNTFFDSEDVEINYVSDVINNLIDSSLAIDHIFKLLLGYVPTNYEQYLKETLSLPKLSIVGHQKIEFIINKLSQIKLYKSHLIENHNKSLTEILVTLFNLDKFMNSKYQELLNNLKSINDDFESYIRTAAHPTLFDKKLDEDTFVYESVLNALKNAF